MIAWTAFLALSALSPSTDDIELQRTVQREIDDFKARTNVPAIAYVVVSGRRQVTGALGESDVQSNSKATSQTIFHLASMAKPFVAASIIKLSEQKRLRLDDPVIKHLPYFRLSDPRFANITIRELLEHTSGLPDVQDYQWDKPAYDAGALERNTRSLSQLKLLSAPGEKVAYSNIGYDLLGDVITKASGVTFEEFVAKTIFSPFKMSSSTFLVQEVPKGKLAQPYVVASGVPSATDHFPYNRIHAPSSTLYSSAADMAHWLQFWAGSWRGPAPINSADAAMMLEDQASRTVKLTEDIRPGQGIGWSSVTIDGVRLNGHGGHDLGFRSTMIFDRKHQVGALIMTNGDSDAVDTDGLALVLIGKMLGHDWSRFRKSN